MGKFVRAWDTDTGREEGKVIAKGLVIDGKEIQAVGDGASIEVDSVSGISVKPGLEDRFLAQIVTANKVAGSAVSLNATPGLSDDSGLKVLADTDMFTVVGTSGLQLDYLADEFQFVPGVGLQLNAVPVGKLPATVTLTDGSRAFTAPQSGVDAVGASDFVTKSQAEGLAAGDFSEQILNLAGRAIIKGEVGYVEGTSGSFRTAKADDPATAIVQYGVKDTSIADGASGSFQNPSFEFNEVTGLVSGFSRGDALFLSTTESGKFQTTSPSVSGETVLDCGWVKPDGTGYVFFPKQPLDL